MPVHWYWFGANAPKCSVCNQEYSKNELFLIPDDSSTLICYKCLSDKVKYPMDTNFNNNQILQLNKLTQILEEQVSEKWGGEVLATACVGSHAYGLATPESDLDVRGIHTVSLRHLLSMNPITSQSTNGTMEIRNHGEENVDINSTELGKFCHLCLKCNPSILEMLFVNDNMIIKTSGFFETLRENRHNFISKKQLVAAYAGYAEAQLERMSAPHVKEALNEMAGSRWRPELFKWENGKLFVSNNSKIFDTYDYDYKNAMHGIRLIISLNYMLQNNEMLINFNNHMPGLGQKIRKGHFSLGGIMDMAYEYMNSIRILEEKSVLPEEPNVDAIDELLYSFRVKDLRRTFDSQIKTFGLYQDWE